MKPNKTIFFFQHRGVLAMLMLLVAIAGCKKLVEVDAPETNPASATVYTKDGTAASVLTSIYGFMAKNSFAAGSNSISVIAGLTADEFQVPANFTIAPWNPAYKNSSSLDMRAIWKDLYQNVYVANAAIEGIAKSTGGMTDSVKAQLTGEAKFMRAFLHFYALNLYGNVPFIDTTDHHVNAIAAREASTDVYNRIVADLLDAKDLLSENYKLPTGAFTTAERCRPNKWAAIAMLARVYLYTGQWAKAETEASLLLANTAGFSLVTDFTKLTVKESKEAIWHIQPTTIGLGTPDAQVLLMTTTTPPTPNNPVSLRPAFLSYFEANDKRRTLWIDSPIIATVKYYAPSKYKVRAVTQGTTGITYSPEHGIVLRVAEQFLIRAEARAKQDKIADAQADLNAIRTRAGLPNTTATDQATLLLAIEKERATELFSEWGHRWLDLKRTNRLDAVMATVVTSKVGAGATWDSKMALYPIPVNEILLNPNLAPQNPGYN